MKSDMKHSLAKKFSRWTSPLLFWLVLFNLFVFSAQAATETDVTRATLKNGLRVVIVRNTLAPVVTTQVNYLVGSNEAPDGFPGMAHALEHMMFRGSPGLSSAQLSNLIAAMGGNFNANTQQIVTQYFFTVPTGDLETALRIEAVRMRDVLATDALWRQERGAIEQEVAQDYSNPQYLFYSRLLAQPKIALQPLKPATIEVDSDLPYGLAAVAYRLPGFNDPDYAAGVVLADALDSRRGELYALAAEGKALSGGFDGMALPVAGFGYANAAFPRGQDSAALITQMKAIIAGYVDKGVNADLVEATKRREVAEAEFRRNSIAGMAAEWSQALSVEGRTSIDDDIEAIKKVTVADVNRVAKKYLINDSAVTVIMTPHESGDAVASEGSRSGGESFAPKQTKAVPLPAWAKKALSPLAVPTSTVNPSLTVLPNGLRLIIQPETISDTVSVYGRVKNRPELQVPAGKEGADQILNDLFAYGSKKLDRIAFQEALDEIGANAQAGTSFSLEVLPDGFARGVELLADNLLHPALPEAAFKAVQQRTGQAVAGQLQSPVYRSGRAFLKAIYSEKDPTLREATPDTIASLTLEDVRSYHEKVFRPDLTTIVVIGKVTPEHARAVIEKYFASWQGTGPKPETDLPPVPRNKASATVVPDRSRVQDQVSLGQTFELKRQDDDYYVLQVGLQVLSGGFYASRLYQDLREKSGLVYSIDAHLQSGKTRSVFTVSYACDPPNVVKARTLIARNLRFMKTKA